MLLSTIFSGTYEINVNGVVVHTYVDEGSFGELALMYNTPRAATVTSRSSGTLWALVSQSSNTFVNYELAKELCAYSKEIKARSSD